MRRPRLRKSKPDASVPPEVITEEDNLRLTIRGESGILCQNGRWRPPRPVRRPEQPLG